MQDQSSHNQIKTKSYVFTVVVEPDEDRWHAYAPALERYGGATWGHTREEALVHIQEVIQMVVEELIEDGVEIPEQPSDQVQVFGEPKVAVTI